MRRAPLVVAVLLAACASPPPAPAWRASAADALQRATLAYLKGDARTEAVEFERARSQLASTGQPEWVARAELARCAAQVASLVFDPCAGFERLAPDAPAAERAYAAFLDGRITPGDVGLLPEQHRAVAGGREDAAALAAIGDPFARLIDAGVLMRSGRASPAVVQAAVDTASQQGWRRPLLAWLGLQLKLAERSGAAAEAQRIRRRIELAGTGAPQR